MKVELIDSPMHESKKGDEEEASSSKNLVDSGRSQRHSDETHLLAPKITWQQHLSEGRAAAKSFWENFCNLIYDKEGKITCINYKKKEGEPRRLIMISFCSMIFIVPMFFIFVYYCIDYAHATYVDETNCIEDGYVTYPSFQSYMSEKQSNHFSILLFGDSLIQLPADYYNLVAKTRSKLDYNASQWNVTINEQGYYGNTISMLLGDLPGVMANHSYDAVIVFWDSDVSNHGWETLSSPGYQNGYQSDVRTLITELQSTYNVTYISIAGPELLGETPFLYRFHDKRPFLDLYRSYNQIICRQRSIPYINIRKSFLNQIPLNQLAYKGTVTRDGEHPNEHGTEIESTLFALQINKWLSADGST